MIISKRVALAVAGVAAAGVIGTAGVAAATAPASGSTPAPTASAPSSGSAAPQAGDRREKLKHRALARGMHGEWVVKGKDGKPVTLVSVRGTVTAVNGTSVTVKAEDGFTATFIATADTKVRGHDVDSMSEVKVGAEGAVVGVKSGGTITARAVLVKK